MNNIGPNNLSEHFTFKEFLHSNKAVENGIENLATHEIIKIGYQSAMQLEKVRTVLGKPMSIDSWFRCLELNRLLGSKDTSQHLQGEAIDFISPGFGTPLEICKEIIRNKSTIPFDQLILEHTWVHISFAIRSGSPRGQVLSLLASGHYASGLTDKTGTPYK